MITGIGTDTRLTATVSWDWWDYNNSLTVENTNIFTAVKNDGPNRICIRQNIIPRNR